MSCRDLEISVKIIENYITVILQSAMIKHTSCYLHSLTLYLHGEGATVLKW